MKASDIFSSKYISAADLRGRDATVTIDRVEIEKMPNSGEKKPALYFRGKDKGLLVNKTNFNTIAEVLGAEDTDDWEGKQITLYPTETDFQGKMVDCIRVRRRKVEDWQAPPVREPEPESPSRQIDDDPIPF
jgi:hypothetical protein